MLAAVLAACPQRSPSPDPIENIETTETARLATLARVWGLLAYHPTRASADLAWEQLLREAIPGARDARRFRATLEGLIDRTGVVADVTLPVVTEEEDLPSFEWLRTGSTIDHALLVRLDAIRRAPRAPTGYVATAPEVGNAVFAPIAPDVAFPSVEQRLVALFRYWNAINYVFPYRHQVDGGWNGVLEANIPRFIAARDATEYHLLVEELATQTRDGHARARSAVLEELRPRTPKLSIAVIQGELVVIDRGDDVGDVKVGDVITSIDGVAAATARERELPQAGGSNLASRERLAGLRSLTTRGERLSLVVRRGTTTVTVDVPTHRSPRGPLSARPAWRRLRNDVGYVDLGRLATADIGAAFDALDSTRGLVFDVRGYPEFLLFTLLPFLHGSVTPFARIERPILEQPGNFTSELGPRIGGGRDDVYPCPIAILVDERTVSRAEYVTMALQTVPGAIVVGSTTAGADGNVSTIDLPGGLTVGFSGIGIAYPDGRPTQRAGIAIDVVASPTIDGLRSGRDEVLDTAIAALPPCRARATSPASTR